MKKAICLALLLCLILSGFAMATASGFSTYTDSYGGTFAQVNNPNPADRLHLRTEPRTGAASLGKYYNGVTVEIIGYPNADWVKVRIQKTEGYMLKQYLSGSGVLEVSPGVTVIADQLNLRAGMSDTSASLGKYPKGTQVIVLGVGTVWHHVTVDGKTGYMMAKYLTPVDGGGSGGTTPEKGWLNVNNPNPADRLHLRTAAKANAESLGKYYNGVSVEVLSYPSNDWAKVRVGSTVGYMQRKFLTTAAVKSAIPILTVNNKNPADRLNLRAGMSEKSNSLGKYGNGTKVEVLGIGDIWYHVRVDGKIGYMMAKYLTPLGNAGDGSSNNGGASTGGSGGSWGGPTGSNQISNWPIVPDDYSRVVAIVNNPNPADRLHLRESPSENAKSLGKYYNGVRLESIYGSGSSTADWLYVGIGNLQGYMKRQYLMLADTPGHSLRNVKSAMPLLEVHNAGSSGNVTVWQMQSAAAGAVGVYPNGTKVVLMGFTDEWAHVIVDGMMGFVQAQYLAGAGNSGPGVSAPKSSGYANPSPGVTKNAVISYKKYTSLSKAELDAAAAAVIAHFQTYYYGCELFSLEYDEATSDEIHRRYGKAGTAPNSICFMCEFNVVETRPGFELGWTIGQPIFLERRDSQSQWVVLGGGGV